MSNFSDYIRSGENTSKSSDKASEKKSYSQADLENMINKYSSLGKDQLMSEFLKLTLEKKRKGELKESELESLKNTLSPMLSSEQRSNLNQILEMVKNVE